MRKVMQSSRAQHLAYNKSSVVANVIVLKQEIAQQGIPFRKCTILENASCTLWMKYKAFTNIQKLIWSQKSIISTYITLKEIEEWLFWNSTESKEEIYKQETSFFFSFAIFLKNFLNKKWPSRGLLSISLFKLI